MVTQIMMGKLEPPSVSTTEEVLAGMETVHADRAVLTPGTNLYLSCVHHDGMAGALMRAYNEWMLDEIVPQDHESDGVYAAALVSAQNPHAAAEEIDDRARESAIAGVVVPGSGTHPPLGDERYWPIYEAAESHGLPVMIHNAAGGMMHQFPMQFQGFSRFTEVHTTSHPMTHMTNLTSLLIQGVPERFSELKFVIQEGGIGWVPFFLHRIDHEYKAFNEDAPVLTKLPSEYVHDQFYFTSQPLEGFDSPEYLANIVRMLGVENLMFSSDFPHFDYDEPEAVFARLRRSTDDEELTGIYGGTALEVFDF
jgi:hypothetical protein